MALTKVSTGVVDMSTSTGGLVIAKGTTAQQPTCTAAILGSIRENTTENKVEVCHSTGWEFLEEVGSTKVPLTVDYLVVAGGGGGGAWTQTSNVGAGGGGGAGGLVTSFSGGSGGGCASLSAFTLTAGTSYTIVVGKGGAGQATNSSIQYNGGDSSFNGITSIGGGAGGSYTGVQPNTGGSGGGAGYIQSAANGTSCQGYAGGNFGTNGSPYRNGGGGGASGTGNTGGTSGNGAGGTGKAYNITGTSTTYAGGGGGGVSYGSAVSLGGSGIGGNGGNQTLNATNSTSNTGSGGGGAGKGTQSVVTTSSAGSSGIIILKYPSVYTIDTAQIGSDLYSTNDSSVSGYTITTIICANSATTGTGTIQFT